MINLGGKIALVTGAAAGIGRASALLLARAGATVAVVDVNDEGCAETASLITAAGGNATYLTADITHAEEVHRLVARVVNQFGRIDYAHNNAGVECQQAPLGESTEADWDRSMAVNLKGVWLCMRSELTQMTKQRGGVIINTSSVGGMTAVPGGGSYSAAKHGVIGLTRTAAVDYATANIRVNAICPGLTRTAMTRRLECERPNLLQQLLPPMRRMAEPEEIAGAVVFLCSDMASYITGHTLVIDGGATAI